MADLDHFANRCSEGPNVAEAHHLVRWDGRMNTGPKVGPFVRQSCGLAGATPAQDGLHDLIQGRTETEEAHQVTMLLTLKKSNNASLP